MLSFYFNFFNIEAYNNFKKNLQAYQIKCPCGCCGQCIKYGTYPRTIIHNGYEYTINIQRIYCKHCKTTHAIIPSFVVPYKRISMDDIVEIIEIYEAFPHDKYDYEANRVIKNYKIWNEKLISIGLSIKDGLKKIISFCATYFKMCFMQNKRKEYCKNSKMFKVTYSILSLPT